LIQLFKRNSIFVGIFAVLLVIAAVTISGYGYFVNVTASRDHREQIHQSNFDGLGQSANTLTTALGFLQQGMRQMLWSKEFLQYGISPLSGNDAVEYGLLSSLENAAESQGLLTQILFYSPYANTVFTSDREKHRLIDFQDVSMLQRHRERRSQWCQLSQDMYFDLFVWQNRLILAMDFVLSEPVATMVFELDTEALYGLIGSDLYLFGENGLAVGNNWSQKTGSSHIDAGSSEILLWEGGEPQGSRMQYYACADSGSGMLLLKEIDPVSLNLDLSEVMAVMLPSCVVFLIIALLGAALITQRIYKPMNHLVNLTLEARGPGSQLQLQAQGKDELDYLTLIYTDTMHHNIKMRQALTHLTDDMLEQTVRNLILGKEMEEGYLEEVFSVLNTTIQSDCYCTVLVCKRMESPEHAVALREHNFYYLSIYQVVSQHPKTDCQVICTQTEPGTAVVVFCFVPSVSAVEAQTSVAEHKKHIEQHMARLNCPSVVERGELYRGLSQVSKAYQQGVQAVNYAIYLAESGEEAAFQEEDTGQYSTRQLDAYTQQVRELSQAAENGLEAKSRSILEQTLEQIRLNSLDEHECRHWYSWLEDTLIERLLAYMGEEGERVRAEWMALQSPQDHQEDLHQRVSNRCNELLSQLNQYARKSQNRYVAEAKRYIDMRFSDHNLTVGMVSEHLGIHAVYFGSLFHEHTKESFSGYLNRVRVEHAKDILSMTRIPVKDVGFKCGFSTVQTFNRVFKKQTKMTPGQYRESVKLPNSQLQDER